ncbi:MAG: hypothetical protein ACYC7D_12835 [Nitrososphaerales archaeon]
MKRSRQLVLESGIVAALIIGIALAGTLSTLSLPPAWLSIPNPVSLTTQYDLNGLALYYNSTMSAIGGQNFSGASTLLNQSTSLSYPPNLATAVGSAGTELGAVNASIPLAISGFNTTFSLIGRGELQNASSVLGSACSQVQNANSSFAQFKGPTNATFARNSVPVSNYTLGAQAVNLLLISLFDQCHLLQNILANLTSHINTSHGTLQVNFTISSTQKTILTGGFVEIGGNLTLNATGLANYPVSLYINGTRFANATTGSSGSLAINASTPFVYAPVVAIWAVASPDQPRGFVGAVSNTLYFKVLFNETEIVVNDPPPVLPTFNFTVQGHLNTKSGIPLPHAPVKITSFGQNYFVTTNASGVFKTTLTVPANATDGLQYIYAAFEPLGSYGPSVNFTSIEVVHEPLQITFNPTSLAFSGFNSTVSGVVRANGTGLAYANLTLTSPWGQFVSKTDGEGRFNVSLPIPITVFASPQGLGASAAASEAYISKGTTSVSIGVLNPLEIALPLLAVAVAAYEAKSLGLFRKAKQEEKEEEAIVEAILNMLPADVKLVDASDVIQLYRQALLLAVRKFAIKLEPSFTIREIMSQVTSPGGEFATISLILEDYLYSERFDQARIETGKRALKKLEEEWK